MSNQSVNGTSSAMRNKKLCSFKNFSIVFVFSALSDAKKANIFCHSTKSLPKTLLSVTQYISFPHNL